jgi:glycosyltransferase involved in cell wall biosynthesis
MALSGGTMTGRHDVSMGDENRETGAGMPSTAVLLILARDPEGRVTGRKNVIASAVRGLHASGATVHIVALAKERGAATWLGSPVERIAPPGLLSAAVQAIVAVVSRRSLSEALFDNGRVRRCVAEVARRTGADVVVADTIRTWGAARATGLPIVAHLDDLLSERYAAMAANPGRSSVLGYYATLVPRRARPIAEAMARRLLFFEARRQHDRENVVARCASVTALTATAEAARLSKRAHVPVRALPMAVDPLVPVDPATAPPGSAVFLGGLDYGPNLEALRWWRDHVSPLLVARGTTVRLTVVGHAEAAHRTEFDGADIDFAGYVDDLRDALAGHRMFLAPVRSGAGVKTKVLDGMSVGLPVVGTTAGLSGVPVRPGVHALVADKAGDFADAVAELVADPDRAAALGRAGHALLGEHFSSRRIASAWSEAIGAALDLRLAR